MGKNTSFTVDVVLHQDFWSEAARKAAAEARARNAGKGAARAAHGKKDAGKRISRAAAAHRKQHGAESARVFKKAAAEHGKALAKRSEASKVARKQAAKTGRKVGGTLLKSMMRANEETKIQ